MASITTIKEIARRLNISTSSVSRALHDHSNIGFRTKVRVHQLAKELNYEPNQKAIDFKKGKTYTIGIILPELSEGFFSAAISGIEDTATKNNYSVLLGQSHNNEEREKEIVHKMKKDRVDGIIVSIAKNTSNYDHFEMLRQQDIPIIFFDCIPNLSDIHYLVSNIELGTEQITKFILENGHRNIGMINGPEKLLASINRLEGFKKALKDYQLKFDPTLNISTDLSSERIRLALNLLINHKAKPTAIILFNDLVALEAIQFALEKKIKINQDISFVSCGHGNLLNHIAYPPLASLEQFPYLQGQKSTELLLSVIKRKQELSPLGPLPYYKIMIEPKIMVNKNHLLFWQA